MTAASSALPGLYPPVDIDGRHYVDGVLLKTLHGSVALDHGVGLLFAVNPIVPIDTAAAVEKGVLEAKLAGGRTREIKVQVDPTRLMHFSLSLNDVIGAISSENVNIPGGDVKAGEGRILSCLEGNTESLGDPCKKALADTVSE